jgi:hypothetical protein
MKLELVTGANSTEADTSADEVTCCSLRKTLPDGSNSDETNNSPHDTSITHRVGSYFLCLC